MAFPTYGLLGAGSAMLRAPSTATPGQVVGAGVGGLLGGFPIDTQMQREAARNKTLSDVREAWLAGARGVASNHPTMINYLQRVSSAESNDRNIGQQINDTGSAFGPFQFTEGTWADQIRQHPELGLTPQDRFNPAAQGRVAVTFTRDNSAALRGALNRDPSPGDLLLAHRFGAKGAISLLTTSRNESVARALPDAVAANPQWAKMTVGQIVDSTSKDAGHGSEPVASQGGGGLLGSAPSPAPATNGLAALFGGVPLAPSGSGLDNMTPEFRNILSIALTDPTLGPMALQTILQVGLGGAKGGGGGIKPTDEIINALASGYQPNTPEWDRVVGKAPGPSEEKPTEIMREAHALYPDDAAAQAQYIKNYREKTAGVTVQNIPQALPVNKAVADKFEGDIANADAARTNLARIEAARSALDQINTGAGAGVVANIGSYLRSAGLDPTTFGIPDTASPAEAVRAISAPMILELRGTGKGGEGGMPGNLSDNDLKFLRSSTINLESQPGANRAILMLQEQVQKRKLDLEALASNHAEANNGQVAGSYLNERRRFINSHPLFDDAFKKDFEAALKTPPAAVTAPVGATAPAAPATPAPVGPPTISDQKAYDALPSGASFQFLNDKGVIELRRKP